MWFHRPFYWLGNTPAGNLALLLGILAFLMAVPLCMGLYGAGSLPVLILKSSQPVFISAFVMWLQLGSPLNWWRPFFGTTMEADRKKLEVREKNGEQPDVIQKEIEGWVENCTKGRWVKLNPYTYKFLRKGDAAFFKLAWG